MRGGGRRAAVRRRGHGADGRAVPVRRQGFYWEIPTGGTHPGETLEEAAQRELAEEAGHGAGRLVKLCEFHTSKSILREVAHLYVGTDLYPASRPRDHTEFIECRSFPFSEVLAMVERGEIKDSMTVIAVLHAARRRDHALRPRSP